MNRIKLFMMCSLLLLLVACQSGPTEEEFLTNTEFEVSLLRMEFAEGEMDTFEEEFNVDDNTFYISDSTDFEETLDSIDHIYNVLSYNVDEGKTYVIVPVFEHLQLIDADATYSYDNGVLTINVTAITFDFSIRDVAVAIIEIDSEYDFEVKVNLEIE